MLAHHTSQLQHVEALSLEMNSCENVLHINKQVINYQSCARKESFFRNFVARDDGLELFTQSTFDDCAVKGHDVFFNLVQRSLAFFQFNAKRLNLLVLSKLEPMIYFLQLGFNVAF